MYLNKKKIFTIIIFTILTFCSCTCYTYAKKGYVPEIVEYEAKDAFMLTGTITLPKGASLKKKVPLVIFVHSLGKNSKAWEKLPKMISQMGIATFNLDLRGHGGSLYDKNEKKRYWQNFRNKDFARYPYDIQVSIDYIKENYPEIDSEKMAIIAADIGANASIIASCRRIKSVKTLVLLSPSMENKGLRPAIQMVGYDKNPVLMIVSAKDKRSYKESFELLKYAQGKKEIQVLPFGGIGMDLIKNNSKTIPIIIEWLKENFISTQKK